MVTVRYAADVLKRFMDFMNCKEGPSQNQIDGNSFSEWPRLQHAFEQCGIPLALPDHPSLDVIDLSVEGGELLVTYKDIQTRVA